MVNICIQPKLETSLIQLTAPSNTDRALNIRSVTVKIVSCFLIGKEWYILIVILMRLHIFLIILGIRDASVVFSFSSVLFHVSCIFLYNGVQGNFPKKDTNFEPLTEAC